MLPRESRAAFTLHEAGGPFSIIIPCGVDANVSGALLHDNAENDTLFDTELGTLEDCVPDASNILACITRATHLGLVEIENLLKGLPLAHGREARRGTLIRGETHFGYG